MYNDELMHYGVKGMKWGVIRSRAKVMNKAYRKSISDDKARSKSGERVTIRQANINAKKAAKAAGKQFKAEQKNSSDDSQTEKKGLSNKQKKAIKVGAAVAGTALATYGAYKLSKITKNKAYAKNMDRGYTAIAKLMANPNKNHIMTGVGHYNKNDKFVQDKLYDTVDRYAKRHSNTTISAVKTLLGKNREFTIPELINQGITVPDIDLWR